ncbi:hypothetical protein BD414DRAFT_492378 [Trametes punicea]|nr:hypothetical protein BD414DRAFT_492378 [Trametes punicea]
MCAAWACFYEAYPGSLCRIPSRASFAMAAHRLHSSSLSRQTPICHQADGTATARITDTSHSTVRHRSLSHPSPLDGSLVERWDLGPRASPREQELRERSFSVASLRGPSVVRWLISSVTAYPGIGFASHQIRQDSSQAGLGCEWSRMVPANSNPKRGARLTFSLTQEFRSAKTPR